MGHVTFDTEGDRLVSQVEPGLFAITRVPHVLRMDMGAYVPIKTGDNPVVGMRMPLALSFQLAEHYHCILHSGLNIDDVHATQPTMTIPAGITIGYSEKLPDGTSAGIAPSLRFPEAIRIGPESPAHGTAIAGSVMMYVVTPP